MSAVEVWREYAGEVEHVGAIDAVENEIRFSYDRAYTGQAISLALPNGQTPATAQATACFFSALIPEGSARLELARMLHASSGEFLPFLEHLNNESIGALLFSVGGARPCSSPAYTEVEPGLFDAFSARPVDTAVSTVGKTRLSLSGAMAKFGLYRDPGSGRWFYPSGGAASTHIIKAADGRNFPLETLNEALCLGVAARCGLPAARCELIPTASGEPLLAIERFDRAIGRESREVCGMPAPVRVHQEDLSQATGVALKYEPTDGDYLLLVVSTASHACANAFGEASLAMEYTLFSYLIGNCDNHLKNYALLSSPDWSTREFAPLYDVANTTRYPNVYLEMGVSFGGDRRIDHMTRARFEACVKRCGLPLKLVSANLDELAQALPGAIKEQAEELAERGFPKAKALADEIAHGVETRYAAIAEH